MEKFHDCDEGGRSTKSGQHLPESVTIDGVEGRSLVNGYHVETFLLDFSGHIDHVHGSQWWDVTKLHYLSSTDHL